MSDRRTPRVLVTDAARGSAVAVIRSLGRRGWHVVAADSEAGSPGFRSRYAAARVRYPDPRRHSDAMVARLRDVVARHRINLVVPVTEDVAVPLARARERIEPVALLALPPTDAFDLARDKARTLRLAEELGIPIPRSRRIGPDERAEALDVVSSWPAVVKPVESRALLNGTLRALEVSYARDRDELSACMARIPDDVTILVQELCRGEGVGVEVLADHGNVIEAFQHRRLHEVPLTGGASSYRESVALDPALLDATERLMRATAWTGLAMVEFKVGPDGPRLMEINPRIWGSLPLSLAAGVDFPARMAALHLGLSQPVDGRTAYAVGVRARNLTLELHWAAAVLLGRAVAPLSERPSRLSALGAIGAALGQPRRSDMFAADDMGPQLAEIARLPTRFGALARKWR